MFTAPEDEQSLNFLSPLTVAIIGLGYMELIISRHRCCNGLIANPPKIQQSEL